MLHIHMLVTMEYDLDMPRKLYLATYTGHK